eukprot:TRINITY_DN14782_c0_g1_i1.p1 TRINITY_DN14782_c0_g1~~TRINITY_DN14782_c0_g1_i1.p1  ORF type:complete len:773 (+),score=121.55 TRINITY_DN14782_c0_g1_i1:49-2319(+)
MRGILIVCTVLATATTGAKQIPLRNSLRSKWKENGLEEPRNPKPHGAAYNEEALRLYNEGVTTEQKHYFEKCLAIEPKMAEGWNNLATLEQREKSLNNAIYAGGMAVKLCRDTAQLPVYKSNLANLYLLRREKNDLRNARTLYRALTGDPYAIMKTLQIDLLLHETDLFMSDILLFTNESPAFLEDPDSLELASSALSQLGMVTEARVMLSKAVSHSPQNQDILLIKAKLEYGANLFREVVATVGSVIVHSDQLLYLLASSLSVLGNQKKALEYYRKISSNADEKILMLTRIEIANQEQRVAEWSFENRNFVRLRRILNKHIKTGQKTSQSPFSCLLYPYTNEEIQHAARLAHIDAKGKNEKTTVVKKPKIRLRIGVVTSDGGDTNVGRDILGWIALLIAAKDVEVYYYSLQRIDGTKWGKGLRSILERSPGTLHIVTNTKDTLQHMRGKNIHIMVNINGFSKYHNHDLFTDPHPGAPIQINYKGCTSTFGFNKTVQFLLANPGAVSPIESSRYDEKLVYMPRSFFATSYPMVYGVVAQAERGHSGVVFCNFNHVNKIRSDMFSVWVSIVLRVPGSILWLMALPEDSKTLLTEQAVRFGLPLHRIKITSLYPLRDHLHVKTQCDLFLDTQIFASHGTAMDVLYAGVPILSLQGPTYQSRVSSDHLSQVGLSDLITTNFKEYEELAVALGNNPKRLSRYRRILKKLKKTLFDTKGWVSDYTKTMWLVYKSMASCEGTAMHVVAGLVYEGEDYTIFHD